MPLIYFAQVALANGKAGIVMPAEDGADPRGKAAGRCAGLGACGGVGIRLAGGVLRRRDFNG